jgi:hypothetical protein
MHEAGRSPGFSVHATKKENERRYPHRPFPQAS